MSAKKKAGRVKARLIYGIADDWQTAVYVLPAGSASHEKMVEQCAEGIWKVRRPNCIDWWHQLPAGQRDECLSYARAALAAIGITRPKEGKK